MRRKYHMKKKRRLISSYKILSILICILLLIAVGYSISTTTLTIIARVNLERQQDIDLPSEKSKSSATWKIKSEPWDTNGHTTYSIEFVLENKDEDYSNWVISMDFPKAVIEEDIQIWGVESHKIEEIGNYHRITFYPFDWNKTINYGDKLTTLGFNIKLSGKTNMKIEHLIFNGKLVTDFKQIGTIYDIDDNDKTNEVYENTTTNEEKTNNVIENSITNTITNETIDTNTTTNEIGEETTDDGESKTTWKIINSWGTTHQIKVEIENNYKACEEWTIVIDVPQGIDESSVSSWSTSSTKVERIEKYDRITFKSQTYNGKVGLGEKVSFEFQINYPETTDFNIYKLVFNGKEINNISKIN